VNKELGADVSIGFLYERFHVFWSDVWTWNGRYVLFAGDRYWEPEPEAWQQLLGSDVADQFAKPILYRIPFGSGVLLMLCSVWVAKKRFVKSEVQKVDALLREYRYRAASEILFGPVSGHATSNADPRSYEEKFHEAVRYLVGQGISAAKAEANLAMIVKVIEGSRQQQVDQLLAVAIQLEQDGEWDKSVEVYSSVVDYLPNGDERAAFAKQRIAAITENQAIVPA
jgi:hypothetical protein